MSGGEFDYAYSKVESFHEQLERKIRENGTIDIFGYEIRDNYNEEVMAILKSVLQATELMTSAMREVEWLYSGDIGEETFIRKMKSLIGEVKK